MKKVMVVEDEEDMAKVLLGILKASGYDAFVCENGAVAWSRLAKETPDLAILDVQMPQMNGLELCQRIRTDARFRLLPILMLTARKKTADQVEGYETGADDYLPKPFDTHLLLARLKALERRTRPS